MKVLSQKYEITFISNKKPELFFGRSNGKGRTGITVSL
jgi:hypothetical protein